MATQTTNLHLKKPAYSDTVDVADLNGNMDIIDSAYNTQSEAIAKFEYIATTTAITDLFDIPINSKGRVKLSSSVSPYTFDTIFNYTCYGSPGTTSSTGKRTLQVSYAEENFTFTNTWTGSAWTGWKFLTSGTMTRLSVSNLSNVPLGTMGACTLTGNASPESFNVGCPYICFGDSSSKVIIINRPGKLQINRYDGSAWSGWQTITAT